MKLRYLKNPIAGVFCAAAIITAPPAISAADNTAAGVIPDFMGSGAGWNMINSNATDYVDPPPGIAKPVTNDPRYPHIGNLQPGQKTDRVADINSPILKDWAKEQMKKTNDAVLRGRTPLSPLHCAGQAAYRRNCWCRPKSTSCRRRRKSGWSGNAIN